MTDHPPPALLSPPAKSSTMSEPKPPPFGGITLFQAASVLVALALGWAAIDARSQASERDLADHEARIRTLEREVMGGLARIEQRLEQIERISP